MVQDQTVTAQSNEETNAAAATSESPRANAAAAAIVTINASVNTEANMQTREAAAGTSELSANPLDYGTFVIIADDNTPTDMGSDDQTVGEVVDYDEDNRQYRVQYCSEEAAAENMSVWCPRERLTEYEEPAAKRQRVDGSA